MRIITYNYDIGRDRWCKDDLSPLPNKQFPTFNQWDSPCFVLKLVSDNQEVKLENGDLFSVLITDNRDTVLAVPSIGHVNNPDDYLETDAREGILSFVIPFSTMELVQALYGFRNIPAYFNFYSSGTKVNCSFSAPVTINKVTILNEAPIPIPSHSQYRINPVDGGTDVWDSGANKWLRATLQNGVLTYYDAPVPPTHNSQYRTNPVDGGTDIWDYTLGKWMREVVINGVTSFYEAP